MPKRISYGNQNYSIRRVSQESYKQQELVSPKKIKQLNDNQGYVNILNQIVKDLSTRPRKYTREQVIQWIQYPNANEKSIRELNLYLRYISNHFNRAIDYFSNILTFDYVIIPTDVGEEEMKQNSFKNNYKKVTTFLNKFNIKQEFYKLMPYMMNEDTVYTYFRENDNVSTFQILPSEFCKIVNKNNVARSYAFDLLVFTRDVFKLTLEDYPDEIQKAYAHWVKEGGSTWYVLDPSKAFAFKFNDWTDVNISPFMGVFLDALQISEDKALQRTKNVISAKQLIHQKIPMREDKDAKPNSFLLDLDTAQQFHETVKSRLDEDGYITVTSPMEMTKVNLDGGASVQANIVRQSEANLYTSLGTSQALFNSEKAGNIGLQKNIQVDENYMFGCYRSFEKFINFIILGITGKHNFNLNFIDMTRFNSDTKSDAYFKACTYGLPLEMHYASSLGIEPKDLESLTYFSQALGLKEKFIPLMSSNTMNSNDVMNASGRPKTTDQTKLADVTTQQNDQGTGDNRA